MTLNNSMNGSPMLYSVETSLKVPLTHDESSTKIASKQSNQKKSILTSSMVFIGAMMVLAITFVYCNKSNTTVITAAHTVVNVETPLG